MKKKIIIALIILVISILIVIGLVSINASKDSKKYNDKLDDYITKVEWSRPGDGDTEFIIFNEKGHFAYYCACGNPIDDYDLCDSYTYDKESKTIKLDCSSSSISDKIKIIKSTEYKLVLEIDGEKRTFKSEYYHMYENPLEFAGMEFESTDKRYHLEFEKDGNYEAYDSEKQEYSLHSGDCWIWIHKEDSSNITLTCNDDTTRKIEIVEYNEDELKLYYKELEETITFHKK